MDSLCFQTFLEHLGEAYAEHHLVVVLDGAPSHTSGQITLPENVSLLRLPSYSPELNPAERWFQEFRRALSNRIFETVELLQGALTDTLEPLGRTLFAYDALLVSPGGWKQSSLWDINALDRYENQLEGNMLTIALLPSSNIVLR